MNKKRQFYLENQWDPYPSIEPAACCGSLLELSDLGAHWKLVLERNFDKNTYQVSKHADEPQWLEILLVGDKISISGDRICLLSPRLESLKLQNHSFGSDQAKAWSEFVKRVKLYFEGQNFIEIATPSLVASPGMEVFLEAFSTQWHRGSQSKTMYLPTSPEFHLKKALAQGFDKIFEVAKVYRNNESGDYHQNEFWMLEWYRAYDNLDSIEKDLMGLIRAISGKHVSYTKKSFAELFREILQFDLKPNTSSSDLYELCRKINVDCGAEEDFDDLFFRIYIEKIEPSFVDYDYLLVHSFPPSQAALARKTKDGWADRFELYAKGVELANAFHELNDPNEQLFRFIEAKKEKQMKGLPAFPVDEEFMNALRSGMPPAGGIALGMDRLFMVLNSIKKIEETRLFPL